MEITIIVLVVMVMVVVITCLLSHYKLSARSFISRHSQARRRDDALSSVSAPPSPLHPELPGWGASPHLCAVLSCVLDRSQKLEG